MKDDPSTSSGRTDGRLSVVRRAPRAHRAPRLGAAGHGEALFARGDMSDPEHRSTRTLQRRGHLCDVAPGNNHRHADPATEGAPHLLRLDIVLPLKIRHTSRLHPLLGTHMHMSTAEPPG